MESCSLPDSVNPGETGTFYLTFSDITDLSDMVSEDMWKCFVDTDEYYKIKRKDGNTEFQTSFTLSNYSYDDEVLWTLVYEVSYKVGNIPNGPLALQFQLANTTTLPGGFGEIFTGTVMVDQPGTTAPPFSGVVLGKGLDNNRNDVKLIQGRLNELGYTNESGFLLDVDSDFGDNTEFVVKNFKHKNGLQTSSNYFGQEVRWIRLSRQFFGLV